MNELQKQALLRAKRCVEDASEKYVRLSIDRKFDKENCTRGTPESSISGDIREARLWLEALLEDA